LVKCANGWIELEQQNYASYSTQWSVKLMSNELQKQLAVLKANYLNSLPSKIDELRSLWQAAIDSKKDETVVELYRKSHSLAGSGATFDQIALSKVAKSFELFLKEHLENGDLYSDDISQRVDTYITKIANSYGDAAQDEAENEYIEDENPVLTQQKKQEDQISLSTASLNVVVEKMKILIADDDLDNRNHLELILKSEGHEVCLASNGKEAVEQFRKNNPDLILMDVVMPVMTGYEAARRIKNAMAERFVPVLFLTAVTDDESLAGCISAGGDDFISKPVHPLLLNAKLASFQRISKMYQKLDEYQRKNEEEMIASKEVFASLIYVNEYKVDGLQTWAKSPGHFSGDTHLYTQVDNGRVYVLLCDFTGHGLPAAIGTVFVSDLFRSMTSKNIPALEILSEINTKMNQILPTGRYCAAIMLDYSPLDNSAYLWNCGLPDVYATDMDRKIKAVYSSENVPLGVVPGEVTSMPYEIDTSKVNEIVIFSDGITEAEDPQGNMYGEKKLISLIENSGVENDLFTVIKTDLEAFMDGEEPTDDISLIVFKFK